MPLEIILSNWDYAWTLGSPLTREEKVFWGARCSAWAPSIMRSVSNWNQSLITNNKQVSCVIWFITVSLQNWLGHIYIMALFNNAGGILNIMFNDLSDNIGIFRLARWRKVRVDRRKGHKLLKFLNSRSSAWAWVHGELPRGARGGGPGPRHGLG